jgi:hypothetical protein
MTDSMFNTLPAVLSFLAGFRSVAVAVPSEGFSFSAQSIFTKRNQAYPTNVPKSGSYRCKAKLNPDQ